MMETCLEMDADALLHICRAMQKIQRGEQHGAFVALPDDTKVLQLIPEPAAPCGVGIKLLLMDSAGFSMTDVTDSITAAMDDQRDLLNVMVEQEGK